MKYVILRDDDTNALTPVEFLERLYRPFLERGLPVNLATIPNVSTTAAYAPGKPELFLLAKNGPTPAEMPIGSNQKLVKYLRDNSEYHIVQHGCKHEFVNQRHEFDHHDRNDIARRLDDGTRHLLEAGFRRPTTFVAPYDQLSRTSLEEVARRFRVLSTGWYDWRRLPYAWLPRYALKKTCRSPHWRVGHTALLTHPGCHLSYHRSYGTMLDEIKKNIASRQITVLVTHWWEYFRDGKADDPFIDVLHATAHYLAAQRDLKVVSFDEIASENVSLN